VIDVVIPFSRPSRFDELMRQLCSQTCKPSRVVMVANGAALRFHRSTPDSLRTAWMSTKPSGPAEAMNVGLEYLREFGDSPWTKWDDDDEYGSDYLEELQQAMEQHPECTMFGKRCHFARLATGLHMFNPDVAYPHETQLLVGPTLSCRTVHCPDFPEGLHQGSDQAWRDACTARGWRGWSTGPDNFVYDRTGPDHVWRATDVQVRGTFGDALLPDGSLLQRPTHQEILADL